MNKSLAEPFSTFRPVRLGRRLGARFAPLPLLCALTIFVNTALPKGGFYIGVIPITWGYLLLGLTAALVMLEVVRNKMRLNVREILALLLLSLFALFNILCLLGFGLETPGMADTVFAYLVSISIVPFVAILSTGYLLREKPQYFFSTLKTALILVSVWGVVHFILMNFFDRFWGIPYVTVTGSVLDIENTRHINRGNVLKMVSTYNNGNILGVNVLMWFPLAVRQIRSLPLAIFTRSIFPLSISRTVWAGWLFAEWLKMSVIQPSLGRLLRAFLLVPVLAGLVVLVASIWFPNPLNFILDEDLGGRIEQLEQEFSLWPSEFSGIREIVYTSIVDNVGWLGLALFLIVWGFPLIVPARSPVARLAKVGLLTYFVLMLSDGAFALVPTQHTYWMVAAVVFMGSSGQGVSPQDGPVANRTLENAQSGVTEGA